jgi:hypothetical protein
VFVDSFLDDPEHDRAEQDDGGEFHLLTLLTRGGAPRIAAQCACCDAVKR